MDEVVHVAASRLAPVGDAPDVRRHLGTAFADAAEKNHGAVGFRQGHAVAILALTPVTDTDIDGGVLVVRHPAGAVGRPERSQRQHHYRRDHRGHATGAVASFRFLQFGDIHPAGIVGTGDLEKEITGGGGLWGGVVESRVLSIKKRRS